MDCDKFDQHVMDALYGELDELTFESLKRHVEGCPRCGAVWSGLKSTRAAAVLPLEETPPGLEARILAAEKTVHHHAPWHRKIMRAAAWAGSHAMRPQLAMAALFMFVIGSSLLLLRTGPSAPVKVSEQGRPEAASPSDEPKLEEEAHTETATRGYGSPKGASPPAEPARDRGDGSNNDGAEGGVAAMASPPGAGDQEASAEALSVTGGSARDLLADGKSTLDNAGCDAAVPKLERVIQQHPDAPERKEAERQLAACKKGAAGNAPVTGSPSATAAPSVSADVKPDAPPQQQ